MYLHDRPLQAYLFEDGFVSYRGGCKTYPIRDKPDIDGWMAFSWPTWISRYE